LFALLAFAAMGGRSQAQACEGESHDRLEERKGAAWRCTMSCRQFPDNHCPENSQADLEKTRKIKE
jgi:hypothetical protein